MQRKTVLALLTAAVLVALGVKYTILQSELKYDVAVGLFLLWLYWQLYERLHQDSWSYGAFILMLVAHNLYLYPYSPLGVRWDHYMHFIGGLSVALIVDRMFMRETWSFGLRTTVIFFMTLGAGGLHEIIEWAGYGILGEGDGFLFFGVGDEGEWQNAMVDMIFNALGALAVVVWGLRRKHLNRTKLQRKA